MTLKFGEFEFDRGSLRLTRAGRLVPLAGQPLELLVLLLEKPGQVVTREQIRRRLWPDTHVDFDPSLNVVLSRLRSTLQEPFIETVPKIGYRFVSVRLATTAPAGRRRSALVSRKWRRGRYVPEGCAT